MNTSDEPVTKAFRVQINDYDSYQTVPSKLDQLYTVASQVPIIRIYGSITVPYSNIATESNSAKGEEPIPKRQKQLQKNSDTFNVVVHVHDAYPYIYVDCLETDQKLLSDPEYLPNITRYLEAVLTESFSKSRSKNKAEDDDYVQEEEIEAAAADLDLDLASANSGAQSEIVPLRRYIAQVSIGKGTPIYGFQLGYKNVYKISLLSPAYRTRLIKLVNENQISFDLKGDPTSKKPTLNVYEGHLAYLLQFLTDYNLYGCGWLDIDGECKDESLFFRSPVLNPQHKNLYTPKQVGNLIQHLKPHFAANNILVHNNTDIPRKYDRIGKSMLEIDIFTRSISNRKLIKPRKLHDDFAELKQFKNQETSLANDPSLYKKTKQIYLSSLEHVDSDLKFQCEIKGSSFLLGNAPSIFNRSSYVPKSGINYFGTGSTDWSNQQELDELLQYVIKLNKPTSLDYETYSKRILKKPIKKSIVRQLNPGDSSPEVEFKTCFELLEHEFSYKYHNRPLGFGSDLIQWNNEVSNILEQSTDVIIESTQDKVSSSASADYPEPASRPLTIIGQNQASSLTASNISQSIFNISFNSNFSDTTEEQNGTPKSVEKIIPASLKAIDKAPDDSEFESDRSDLVSISSAGSDSIDWGDDEDEDLEIVQEKVEPDKQGKPGEQIDEIDEILEETQIHEIDENIMFELTQKRSKAQPSNPSSYTQAGNRSSNSHIQIPSSFEVPEQGHVISSASSQAVVKTLVLGPNAFEVAVPEDLHPSKISDSFDDIGILKINYLDPFYEDPGDLPTKPLIFANKKITVPLKNIDSLESSPMSKRIEDNLGEQGLHNYTGETSKADTDTGPNDPFRDQVVEPRKQGFNIWQYSGAPPSKSYIHNWLNEEEQKSLARKIKFKSQIEPGISGTHFKLTYNSEKVERKPSDFNNLSNMYLELHTSTDSHDLLPNPSSDPPSIIFYHFDDSNSMFTDNEKTNGILLLNPESLSTATIESLVKFGGIPITVFEDELLMIEHFVDLVELFDPDILSGYEVNASSWGYLVERFRTTYDINLMAKFSRGSFKSNGKFGDRWGYTHTSNLKINGRHLINVWRVLRSDLALTSYTFENICFHLLHRTIARYSNYKLTEWFRSGRFSSILLVLTYYIQRMDLTLKIIGVRELISRNVEHSRLIGIDFNSNFYRGSQFKVESILSRITKSENLLLNSPSKDQVHKMRPIECISLILEPDSNFYKSPLVVLDFQSLYPSIMIAYNYCFSTLIGKLHNFVPTKNNVGYIKNVPLPPGMVDLLVKEDGVNLSPNGYMFVKSHVRKSILAKMLEEILDTRLLVKTVMKLFKDDSELTKLNNARQLALKLIANVTYGYTSATFSGRMPNSDVADAIVSTGREILTKSIEIIESGNYGAKVVYGDTDSLFVYFPGKTKADAFRIGRHIAEHISNQFPDPVTLKFEKVYHPCVLLTKKRYVGYSYEYEEQKEPKFDAKGIETVRRDGVPAQQKIVEKALRILFETQNLSSVKNFALDQFYKIVSNRISINDFCFAKEVRFGTYKNEMYLPPGAIVAEKKLAKDPRKEPQYRERVAYVVIKDGSKPRIKDRCVPPEDYIESFRTSNPLNLDYEYYITRVLIPPLERIFNLIGVDIKGWYKELPKFMKVHTRNQGFGSKGPVELNGMVRSNSCMNCEKEISPETNLIDLEFPGNRIAQRICDQCRANEIELLHKFSLSLKRVQLKHSKIEMICDSCVAQNYRVLGGIEKREAIDVCENLNCSVFYRRVRVRNEEIAVEEGSRIVFEELGW